VHVVVRNKDRKLFLKEKISVCPVKSQKIIPFPFCLGWCRKSVK